MTQRIPATLAVLFLATTSVFAQDTTPPTAPALNSQLNASPPPAVMPTTGRAIETAPTTLTAPELSQPAGQLAPEDPLEISNVAAPTIGTTAPVELSEVETNGTSPISEVSETTASQLPATIDAPTNTPENLIHQAEEAWNISYKFLNDGGPSIWAIAALAVITLALILWKVWRLTLIGAWSRGKAGKAVEAFERGDAETALAIVRGRKGIRSIVAEANLTSIQTMTESRAREETARVAKHHLAQASIGLGALELIATIAPLLGLLGTVLGMIAAFQALQEAGSKADPALLAGGIWEALLTTAAGMAVAIPASASLTWFEAVINRIRRDLEDNSTRIFVTIKPEEIRMAAE